MKVKCFITERKAIPEFCQYSGVNPIEAEYQFDRAELLGIICTFDVEMTAEQKQALEKRKRG